MRMLESIFGIVIIFLFVNVFIVPPKSDIIPILYSYLSALSRGQAIENTKIMFSLIWELTSCEISVKKYKKLLTSIKISAIILLTQNPNNDFV